MINLTIEELFGEESLDAAIKRVIRRSKREKRDEAEAFGQHWKQYGQCWIEDISRGNYQPSPYRGKWIPKKNGIEMRMLSIPETKDKILQLTTAMELAKDFDKGFHQCSYGFRKHRSIHQAVRRCVYYANKGKIYAADMDIKSFFDNIDHSVLLRILEKNIRDKRIVGWIEKIIKAGTSSNGKIIRRNKGISQGSPLSPLLANIVLNELDWFMERSKISFVRYADDIVLFCENLIEAEQSLRSINEYMSESLCLQLNWNKTYVYALNKMEYLGYQFQQMTCGWRLMLGREKQKELLYKAKQYIKDGEANNIEWWNKIGAFNRGWINYYRNVPQDNIFSIIKEMDELEWKEIQERIEILNRMNKREAGEAKYTFLGSAFVLNELWYQKIVEEGKT